MKIRRGEDQSNKGSIKSARLTLHKQGNSLEMLIVAVLIFFVLSFGQKKYAVT